MLCQDKQKGLAQDITLVLFDLVCELTKGMFIIAGAHQSVPASSYRNETRRQLCIVVFQRGSFVSDGNHPFGILGLSQFPHLFSGKLSITSFVNKTTLQSV